ncbi:MAG TPA: HEPN domain-containing protein [Armatimonadota bacterium]|nr:HEPN domain-containing protein [Armatimonadota bacterium]
MIFTAIQDSLETCRVHLDTVPISDLTRPELESRLVASLVLLIVSEYEVLIENLFNQRVAACGDAHVCNYFRKSIGRKFRSPDLSKITEVLRMFGSDYEGYFSSIVFNTPEQAAWDNIIKERHAVVHKSGNRQLTLRELLATYPQTCRVIHALKQTLRLP